MGFLVVDEDHSHSLVEEQLGKLREEEQLEIEWKREYTDLKSSLGETRACRLPYLILGFDNDRRGMSGSKDVRLRIFITSMSGDKSLTFSLTASSISGDHQA